MKDTYKAVLASYARTAGVAVLSVYIALQGEVFDSSGLKALLYAAIVSIAGPALRAANPHDTSFGKLQAPEHDEEH